MWKLKNTLLLNNQLVKKEITQQVRKYETNETKIQHPKVMGYNKSSAQRKINSSNTMPIFKRRFQGKNVT